MQCRVVANIYGITVWAMIKFALGMSSVEKIDETQSEVYLRLRSIFAQNKYGYNTRFMSDFDLLLEGVLNERFIDESTLYYDDPVSSTEIADMEKGLNSDFAETDIKNLLKDKQTGAHSEEPFKSLRYPGRVGSNY